MLLYVDDTAAIRCFDYHDADALAAQHAALLARCCHFFAMRFFIAAICRRRRRY